MLRLGGEQRILCLLLHPGMRGLPAEGEAGMALAAENCTHWGFHEQTTALILQSHPAIEGERNIKGLPSRDVSRRTQREPTAASTHHQRPWKRLYSVQNSYTGLGKELCAQQQWDRKGWGIGMHGKDGQTSPPPREEGLQRQDGGRMGAGRAEQPRSGGAHPSILRSPPRAAQLPGTPQQPGLCGPRIAARGSTCRPWIPGDRNARAQTRMPTPHTHT